MSVYSDGRSVGQSLAGSRLLAPGMPAYDGMTRSLEDEVRKSVQKEAERKRAAIPVLMHHALDPEDASALSKLYPEYRVIFLNTSNPVHAHWQAQRFMATNVAIDAMLRYSKSVIVLGDGLYQCATRKLRDVHLESDPSVGFPVHAMHESASEYVKVAKTRATLQRTHGYELSSACFRDFLQAKAFKVCDAGSECTHQAGCMVFDLSMHPLSVKQACAAMVQSGAQMAQAFIPYTPDVFRVESGEVGWNTGVYYKEVSGNLVLRYVEGVAGATSYPVGLWNEWLRDSTVRVPFGKTSVSFRVELLQHRGPFMHCRVVRLEGEQPAGVTRHALELPWAEGKYLVNVRTLVSATANPHHPGSWEDTEVLLPADVVEKLYLHALSLDQAQFSPEAVFNRACIIDSRVITQGMNVRLRQPLNVREAMALTVAVYSKAFVVRYEMGRLTSDMMESLKAAVRWSTSRASRLAYVAYTVVATGYDVTLGRLFDKIKQVLLEAWPVGSGQTELPTFVKPPRFLLLDTYDGWLAGVVKKFTGGWSGGSVALPSVRGAKGAVISFGVDSVKSVSGHIARGAVPETLPTGVLEDDIVDMSVPGPVSAEGAELVRRLETTEEVTRHASPRMHLDVLVRKPQVDQSLPTRESFDTVEDMVGTINEVAECIFPGMAEQEHTEDVLSMREDPQERQMQVAYMEHPISDPTKPGKQLVYKSLLKSYNVERKRQTLQETLTAIAVRNTAAPALRLPCDENEKILQVWAKLKSVAFRPDCEELLAQYSQDKVGFEKELLEEWTKQANPANVRKVMRESLEGFNTGNVKAWVYEVMLKADGKPPMSDKPLRSTVPPQVIAMQKKYESAVYSSIFRLMSRRFISLLSPKIMVNLLKDTAAIRDHIAANHPFGVVHKYLENDFSKFDKSQDRFSFLLFQFIMSQLGFDDALLARWFDANENVVLQSVALGLIMSSMWQNKSGGPATAIMNVVMNIAAVVTCYAGSVISWGVFMGDDSLVACTTVVATQSSLSMMAEVFNFEAKYFILEYPYFTSCFVLISDEEKQVFMVPDPVKRVQKWAQSVSAENPQWEDRQRSASEALAVYRHKKLIKDLAPAVAERYSTPVGTDLVPMFDCIATASAGRLRELYSKQPVYVYY